ncbi:MAG: LysR family transcriptional regulator, partial [Lysobacterales bacterium]
MNNWENLRVYLAVARQGTATAAALELRVSHATVLRRIDQLENELGVRLFKRLQTGYELTEVGTGLLDGASALERNIDEL